MLLNIENLDCLLREQKIKESQVKISREQIFDILKSSKRDNHNRVISIAIPKDKEYLFWYIINEFERLHHQWGRYDITYPIISSSLNDIISGNSLLEHNFSESGGKKSLLLKMNDNFLSKNKTELIKSKLPEKIEPVDICEIPQEIDIPQDITYTYNLHFYFKKKEKVIIVKRHPKIKKTLEPKYKNGILTFKRRKIKDLEPRLMALYVWFRENDNGIKKEELISKYNRYKKIYNEIISKRSYEQEQENKCPSLKILTSNISKYINELNQSFEQMGILPLYYIRQYKCKKRGEKYFLAINFINSDKVQRK